jgi:uracil-DNA glycosylase
MLHYALRVKQWEGEILDESRLTSWVSTVRLMAQGYHLRMLSRVRELCENHIIYPPHDSVFAALELVSFDAVKVIILGQDPYHGPNQAHGLSFSVPAGVSAPPSLRNILKEVAQDVGPSALASTDLTPWATQGVLLLNAILTVEAGRPGSHSELGWLALTDGIIEALSEGREHLVFILWGRFAQSKQTAIDNRRHLVLTAAHPSPFSAHRGFFGSRHFSRANAYLELHGREPIQW